MIDILLATYNGEKFLEQQLLSLVGQTEKNWICYIHDDGSSDKTIEIIKKWVKIDKRFILIDDGILLKNSGKNFLHLLKYSTSDFVCFCDQDDVWLDTKLERLVRSIIKKDNTIPQVVFSNSYLWKSDSNLIYGNATLAFPTDIESLLFLNCGIQGAAGIFNKKMRDVLFVPLKICAMHDWYLTIVGCTFGEIDYIEERLMLYRQHGDNVTGFATGTMKEKFNNVFKTQKPLIDCKHYESLIAFFSQWSDYLSPMDKKNIENFIQSVHQNFFYRFFMIIRGRWRLYDSKIKLIAKFFLRPYWEKT